MMPGVGCVSRPEDLPLPSYGPGCGPRKKPSSASSSSSASSASSTQVTIVLMSYAGGVGPSKLAQTVEHYLEAFPADLAPEVVLVWNSPRSTLFSEVAAKITSRSSTASNATDGTRASVVVHHHPYPQQQQHHRDSRRPLFRVEAFDDNSLLNRFHPRVAPRTAAVTFSDDDKLLTVDSVRVGLAKWCCGNADRAVGAIGRRFWPSKTGIEYHTSGRMQVGRREGLCHICALPTNNSKNFKKK